LYLLSNRQDGLIKTLLHEGTWEESLLDRAKIIIQKSGIEKPIFVDIGANIGVWSLNLANHVHEVYAFEPQRLVHQQLCANLFVNSITNTHTYCYALGSPEEQDTIVQMDHSSYDIGTVCISTHSAGRKWFDVTFSESVLVKTLDDTFKNWSQEKLNCLTLLKIDVECHEFQVLQGATKTLQKAPNVSIIFESSLESDRHALIVSFLSDLGFHSIQPIDDEKGNWLAKR
jgi:FkbM family methyltransferase